jgi:hypothetical protein
LPILVTEEIAAAFPAQDAERRAVERFGVAATGDGFAYRASEAAKEQVPSVRKKDDGRTTIDNFRGRLYLHDDHHPFVPRVPPRGDEIQAAGSWLIRRPVLLSGLFFGL